VAAKTVRIFVATRLFPSYLPDDGYICSKCRLMYNKWKAVPEFYDILTTIDDSHQITNTTIDDISNEDASSSDNQSVDGATNDDHIKNKEMSSDGNSEAVSYVRYPL
jgi:hypothetical protein